MDDTELQTSATLPYQGHCVGSVPLGGPMAGSV